MRAGPRNHRIEFQRTTTTVDDYGGEVTTWSSYCTAWASVTFGTGQERREAAQELAAAPATFRVLWNSKTKLLTPLDRVNFMDAVWDITSVVPLGLNEGVEVTAVRAA